MDSSTLTSNIKIRPFLSIFLSKTSTLLLPIYPIATPQELVLPLKNIGPYNSSAHFFQLKMNGFLAKSKNPLEPIFLKNSDILILFREFCSPLTLFRMGFFGATHGLGRP